MKTLFNIAMKLAGKTPPMKMDPALYRSMQKPLDKLPRKVFKNPGFHVQAEFITEQEEMDLLMETGRLREKYSFVAGEPMQVFRRDANKKYNRHEFARKTKDKNRQTKEENGGNKGDDSIEIVPRRVTGRPEFNNSSPWAYGDDFQLDGVPNVLKMVADRIKNHYEKFHSGPKILRDITINYRTNGMFRLDPHVDPLSDGRFVFVLSLDSDVVFTLSPPHSNLHRSDVKQISLYSWSDNDIDVLLKRRAIVGLAGEARNPWRHGIRTGVDVPNHGICDWFGSHDVLIKRGNERTSVVFAFE